MKKTIDFNQFPYQYPMCLNRTCSQADNCLRQLAEQASPADIPYWTIISPKHQEASAGRCTHFRPATKIRYGKGFIRLLDNLPYNQRRSIIPRLIALFGRRTYYRVRKGERLLTPTEQKHFSNLLLQNGVPTPHHFDAYEEDYNW